MSSLDLRPGDRIEYIGASTIDGVLDAGATGAVAGVQDGWVHAVWRTAGAHRVPIADVRPLPPEVARIVPERPNAEMWPLLGAEPPASSDGRPRNPYLEQGCHPDVVVRVWDELGPALARDSRAQAKGTPVLAHPDTDRIFAMAHGTAYAMWLTPADHAEALDAGATTRRTWSGGSVTDLAELPMPGWIWGRWLGHEPRWVRNAYAAVGAHGG
jgi:hypothetical protein